MSKKKNIEPEEVLFGVRFGYNFTGSNRMDEATYVLMNPYMVDAPPLLLSSYMEYKVLLGSILERTPFAFKNIAGERPAWNFQKGERHFNGGAYYAGVKFLTPSKENMLEDVKRDLENEFDDNTDIAYLPYEISGRVDPNADYDRIDTIQSYG